MCSRDCFLLLLLFKAPEAFCLSCVSVTGSLTLRRKKEAFLISCLGGSEVLWLLSHRSDGGDVRGSPQLHALPKLSHAAVARNSLSHVSLPAAGAFIQCLQHVCSRMLLYFPQSCWSNSKARGPPYCLLCGSGVHSVDSVHHTCRMTQLISLSSREVRNKYGEHGELVLKMH